MRPEPPLHVVLTPEQARSRRTRNIAIALLIAALVLLFYVITIAKLGSHVFSAFDAGQ